MITGDEKLEHVRPFQEISWVPQDYVQVHHQNAIGTKWEFEGARERSNAGIGSLRAGLDGLVRGDGAVTRGRGKGGRGIG